MCVVSGVVDLVLPWVYCSFVASQDKSTVIVPKCTVLCYLTYGILPEIRDLYLYPPALRIRARLKRAHSILNSEPMRDQLPHIAQHARPQKPDSSRPRIRIPILEPDIDLPRRHPHKR